MKSEDEESFLRLNDPKGPKGNSCPGIEDAGGVAREPLPMSYRIGIDAGSKTLKLVVLDGSGNIVYDTYMRHRANIAGTLKEAIHDLNWRTGPVDATIAMTGSAAIEVAKALGIPHMQEVVATTRAVKAMVPQADVAIELGGEDAKIIYFTEPMEQRMNATCAGGTGGFIDNIAYMLDVKPSQMSQLAYGSQNIHPIASRCAVFAQSDVRPLLNSGTSKADIAASVFEAVVRQTLSGLACGRPITGNVVFLGGPLEYMPYLVHSFRKALDLDHSSGIKPPDAHLFTVKGTAILSNDRNALKRDPVLVNTRELEERIDALGPLESDIDHLDALFETEEELAEFQKRHEAVDFPRANIYDTKGPLYVGVDAGSTTLKLVAIDERGKIVYSVYEPVKGDLVKTLKAALLGLYWKIAPPAYLPKSKPKMWIARACATGYGEELLKAAFGVDDGLVETSAHLRSAVQVCPDLTFLLDIGGQDMKALWVKNGMVVDATLNEACSSGCGAFIEGTAASLKSTVYRFAEDALKAKAPIDLGTKCTVFMSSRVKHAQKTGALIEDIAAGTAYSVVSNVLHRMIGDDRAPTKDDKVVVQGGTFKSDAVLRAFEKMTGVEAIRPAQAHLMGALGCALHAKDVAAATGQQESTIISLEELEAVVAKNENVTCTGCPNACSLTIATFDEGKTRCFISNNKCENGLLELQRRRAASGDAAYEQSVAQCGDDDPNNREDVAQISRKNESPVNLVALEQRLLRHFSTFTGSDDDGKERNQIRIGLLDSMALYHFRPFWHTLLKDLGFSVVLPDEGCENDKMSHAWETIPSESVCFPAKTSHIRCFNLSEKGSDAVLMPAYVRNNHCPVQTQYAKALASNIGNSREENEQVPLVTPELSNYRPKRFLQNPESMEALLVSLNDIIDSFVGLHVGSSEGENGTGFESGSISDGTEASSNAAADNHASCTINADGTVENIAPISMKELEDAAASALEAQKEFDSKLESAAEKALAWLEEAHDRHGLVLAGRPYHMDPALLHGIDKELQRLGFAVFPPSAFDSMVHDRHLTHLEGDLPWIPAKRLVGIAKVVAENPRLDAVFLESFGCGFEPLSIQEAADILEKAGKPSTTLKIDDISDLSHIRIRLRTLAESISMRKRHESSQGLSSIQKTLDESCAPQGKIKSGSKGFSKPDDARKYLPNSLKNDEESISGLDTCQVANISSFLQDIAVEPLNEKDLHVARHECAKDICFTANAMAARVIRMLREDPTITTVELPDVCESCVTDAIPRIVERATGLCPRYATVAWDADAPLPAVLPSTAQDAPAASQDAPKNAILESPGSAPFSDPDDLRTPPAFEKRLRRRNIASKNRHRRKSAHVLL